MFLFNIFSSLFQCVLNSYDLFLSYFYFYTVFMRFLFTSQTHCKWRPLLFYSVITLKKSSLFLFVFFFIFLMVVSVFYCLLALNTFYGALKPCKVLKSAV